MATSGIFTSFDIKDKEKAERFVEALDESANEPEWKPIAPIKSLLNIFKTVKRYLKIQKVHEE